MHPTSSDPIYYISGTPLNPDGYICYLIKAYLSNRSPCRRMTDFNAQSCLQRSVITASEYLYQCINAEFIITVHSLHNSYDE